MRIEVRAQSVELSPALTAYAERRLSTALDRVAARIPLVLVRLADENGLKGGVDKCCRVDVTIPRGRDIVVEERHDDLYTAIDLAADRTARVVLKELDRRRESRTEAAEHREALKTGQRRTPSAK